MWPPLAYRKDATYGRFVPARVQDELLRLVVPGGHRGVGSGVARRPEVQTRLFVSVAVSVLQKQTRTHNLHVTGMEVNPGSVQALKADPAGRTTRATNAHLSCQEIKGSDCWTLV